MPKRIDLKKVLVIGSGPIVIGQAAEFDYSGTQALNTLKDEGIKTVLINSNPATIMTDTDIADKVYLEPLTCDFLKKVIIKERPDAILPTLGGQTALNLALTLSEDGFLEKENIELLGVNLETIKKAEDREEFKQLMLQMNEPIPESTTVNSAEEAKHFLKKNGLPLIIRPAFTLGGAGGGIANSEKEFFNILNTGISSSPINQCLIEKSIAGFKEIEYEIIRDKNDNCIVVCNMENIDPVGIHTGDSIVVAPSQTLSDKDHQLLRDVSLKLVRELKIEGGCNVQLALDPNSFEYYIIEVNPRVSRSSALASKATGYPIAQVATLISLGYTLDEIINPITKNTYACFEPALDYIVTKIPRWPFDKFHSADRRLGTQMMATGEVMAIGRTFEESFLKAIRGLEIKRDHIDYDKLTHVQTNELIQKVQNPTDERIFELGELLRRQVSVQELHSLTKIDLWFLNKIRNIISIESELKNQYLNKEILLRAKKHGFSDSYISRIKNLDENKLRNIRKEHSIIPIYKMVDTCSAEFESKTPYFYSTYETENESTKLNEESVIVLGSGPIRIGQGVEFDYATVHCIKAIKELGKKAIVINNNPETVSTDFNISDKLYFEAVTFEDVMNVIELEEPIGVICQFGGQTAINLIERLEKAGVRVLGSSFNSTDLSENRERFEKELTNLDIAQPLGSMASSTNSALEKAQKLGYPLMLRPSYVIGGQAMQIVYSDQELENYMKYSLDVWPNQPVLIDRYMIGVEVEVDAICDGENVFIPGIMEHIERSGVHSGDSFAVYPPQNLSNEIKNNLIDITTRISIKFKIIGLVNIQFIVKKNKVYVLEVNPRSSRTVPFLSKVTKFKMANIATKAILGRSLKSQGLKPGLQAESDMISIKAPVFSFTKLKNVDSALGPEMKSTGEAMGRDKTIQKALNKAFKSAGIDFPLYGTVLVTVADKHKSEVLPMLKRFTNCGFKLMATPGTAKFLESNNLKSQLTQKINFQTRNLIDEIKDGNVQLIINTITKGKNVESDGYIMRKTAVENGVICMTSLDTTMALLEAIELFSLDAIHI